MRHAEPLRLVGGGDEDKVDGAELHGLGCHGGGHKTGRDRTIEYLHNNSRPNEAKTHVKAACLFQRPQFLTMLWCITSVEGAVKMENILMGRRGPPANLGIHSRIGG